MNADALFLLATQALKVIPPVLWLAAILISALWIVVVTRAWRTQ